MINFVYNLLKDSCYESSVQLACDQCSHIAKRPYELKLHVRAEHEGVR